jgi:hypothetical protein
MGVPDETVQQLKALNNQCSSRIAETVMEVNFKMKLLIVPRDCKLG